MFESSFTASALGKQADEQAAGSSQVPPLIVDSAGALLDSLPRIESAVLESLNIIFGADRRISFEWTDGSVCTAVLLSYALSGPIANLSAELLIEARLGPHDISIGLASAAFIEPLDGANAALLPSEIKCALLESYLGGAVATLERAGGLIIGISAITHSPQELPDRGYNFLFEVRREGGIFASSGYLSLDFQGLGCFAAILKNQDHPLAWDRIDHLRVPVGFILGTARLRLSEINSLAGDDIVLLDGIAGGSEKTPPIRVDLAKTPFWLAQKTDQRLVVEKRVEYAMEDNANEAARKNVDLSDLEEIELELVFELGRRSMPLAEVRRIGPGTIFDLASEWSKPVSIHVNGGCIGKGELVTIDNRLGVRLTQYFPRQERCDDESR
jgi:type III secretion protein Q